MLLSYAMFMLHEFQSFWIWTLLLPPGIHFSINLCDRAHRIACSESGPSRLAYFGEEWVYWDYTDIGRVHTA